MDEKEFEEWLRCFLLDGDEAGEIHNVYTFDEEGVLTLNSGLVVNTKHGTFQLTINKK